MLNSEYNPTECSAEYIHIYQFWNGDLKTKTSRHWMVLMAFPSHRFLHLMLVLLKTELKCVKVRWLCQQFDKVSINVTLLLVMY